jgi:hypothetical protein
MAELLRAPSLRSIEFCHFCFTDALCQATANALKEGAAITSLAFHRCSFPDGKSEKIASALKRNATLTTFSIYSDGVNEAFYDAMAASLLSNLDARTANYLQLRAHRTQWRMCIIVIVGFGNEQDSQEP